MRCVNNKAEMKKACSTCVKEEKNHKREILQSIMCVALRDLRSLACLLNANPTPPKIQNPEQIKTALDTITTAIITTISVTVPISKERPDAKRWWNSKLTAMRKNLNKLRSISFKFRALTNHPSHKALKRENNRYSDKIILTKKQHWENDLENITATDIWSAKKYLKDPPGDGGQPRIPSLKTTYATNIAITADNNTDKATLLASTFFPPPNTRASKHPTRRIPGPSPLPDPPPILITQIKTQIADLLPYKAPGPDSIPNIVLKECSDLLAPSLTIIFNAILDFNTYYNPWKESTTIVLRKPGKPNYETPKAYRPIALISTLAKLLTAIIAENFSNITETFKLLPSNHFGGHPGRSTADAIHYLTNKILHAWCTNKVASVLFLDVKGAFPNAVTTRLLHNLKKRRTPHSIVNFVEQLLKNRKTRLKFNDYTSDPISILNRIGQGDPLSMLLYIYYNADILDTHWSTQRKKMQSVTLMT